MKVRHATLMAALVYSGMALVYVGLVYFASGLFASTAWGEEISSTMSVDAKFRALDADDDGFVSKGALLVRPAHSVDMRIGVEGRPLARLTSN